MECRELHSTTVTCKDCQPDPSADPVGDVIEELWEQYSSQPVSNSVLTLEQVERETFEKAIRMFVDKVVPF